MAPAVANAAGDAAATAAAADVTGGRRAAAISL